jgi:hypothetical protein
MAQETVDFAYLEDFAAGDEALVVEVLGIFREQAVVWDAGLASATPAETLHALKGAARGVGAFVLGDLCEAAERGGAVAAVRLALAAAVADIEGYLTRIGGG